MTPATKRFIDVVNDEIREAVTALRAMTERRKPAANAPSKHRR
jgi:hypothetical protein